MTSLKPEQLLLPPNFIHSKNFHRDLVLQEYDLKFLRHHYSKQHFLWYKVIAQTIRFRESREYDLANDFRKQELAKYFCESIKGMFKGDDHNDRHTLDSKASINQSVLFLEGLSGLPNNLIDESFIQELRSKYNDHNNFAVPFMSESKFYVLFDTHTEFIGSNFNE